jgi:Flp pilus assembly protein TadD
MSFWLSGPSRAVFAIGAALLALAAFTGVAASQQTPAYANPAECATCHAAIARTYAQTGMARSFRSMEPGGAVAGSFDHPPSGALFQIIPRAGRYAQRRSQKGYRGAETNVEEKQMDYVIGSGNHARTYLHLTPRNTLQELPVGWYAESGGSLGMSPGYDKPDHLYSLRTVSYECMSCHNAYPKIPAANREYGSDPVFATPLPEGIDCQRCHGPGQSHVDLARAASSVAAIRGAIVNPSRLDPARRQEICLQCHLESSSSPLPHAISRFERGPFSFMPGQPLGDFVLSFRPDPSNDRFEIADTAGRLRQSACFLQSAGKLQCTTCHNPHDIPRGPAARTHYDQICGDCHSGALRQEVAAGKHTTSADCVTCHMPPRRTDDATHVVMTDHYIRRQQPGENISGAAPPRRVLPSYPDPLPDTPENQLYLAVAQIRDGTNLVPGVADLQKLVARYRPARGEFYFELADGLRARGQGRGALTQYDEAVRRNPRSALLTRGLANMLIESGQAARAETTVRNALTAWPDDSVLWSMLGQIQLTQQKSADAILSLRKAVQFDPEMPEVWNTLGTILAPQEAEKAFREAARLLPSMAEAYANLGLLLSERDAAEAAWNFSKAIQLKPTAATRLNYAFLLARQRDYTSAERQAAAAIESDPASAEAHELYGNLLGRRGDSPNAEREFKEAIRLKPGFALAQFELGAALAKRGDSVAAIPYLREAARTGDPAIRNAAVRGLTALRTQ